MLLHLSIRNIVTIESVDIPFAAGLNVLTGETGAGKSILLDALGLALGGRADKRLLRAGSDQASVTAQFNLSDAANSILTESGIEIDDERLLLRRQLGSDGKSRAFVNDQPVSITLLKQLGDALLEIHGQHDQQQLTSPASQRQLLDQYAKHTRLLSSLAEAHAQWKQATHELQSLEETLAQALREQDYLRHIYDELKALAPQQGEAEQLSERRRTLMQAEKLAATLNETSTTLESDQSPGQQISNVIRTLSRAHSSLQQPLEPVVASLEQSQDHLLLACEQLESLRRQFDFNPHELDAAQTRLFALNDMARKHQVNADDLAQLLADTHSKLGVIDQQESHRTALVARVKETREDYVALATTLHEKRNKAAIRLEKAITSELKPLKMQHCQSKFSFSQLPQEQWAAHGDHRIQLDISTNAGSSFGPLQQVASGGELSRLMLAIKSIAAGTSGIKTLIFDEIDTGTGGATADAIGLKLASISEYSQTLVVTHLPQVAARAAHHLFIDKQVKKNHTFTQVALLDSSQQEEEVARMLSGAKITTEAREAAKRLMEPAA